MLFFRTEMYLCQIMNKTRFSDGSFALDEDREITERDNSCDVLKVLSNRVGQNVVLPYQWLEGTAVNPVSLNIDRA